MEYICEGCKAKCCKYVTIEMQEPKTKEDFDEVKWYFLHKNIEIFIEDGKWHIQFNSRCRNLDENNRCSIYSERPDVCREHSASSCEHNGTDDINDKTFKNYNEFLEYMKEKGVDVEKE